MVLIQFKNGRRAIYRGKDIYIEHEDKCVVLRSEEKIVAIVPIERVHAVLTLPSKT